MQSWNKQIGYCSILFRASNPASNFSTLNKKYRKRKLSFMLMNVIRHFLVEMWKIWISETTLMQLKADNLDLRFTLQFPGPKCLPSACVKGEPACVTRPRHTKPRLRQISQRERHSQIKARLYETDAER